LSVSLCCVVVSDVALLVRCVAVEARLAFWVDAESWLVSVAVGAGVYVLTVRMSGGMQRGLAIAQAHVKKPRILLLDEPFGALDPGSRLDMHELITKLWREHGLTIMMVTHDIKEAFKLGTRVLAFDQRRRDPQAPHRYGSTAVYDFPLDKKDAVIPDELTEMTAR